MGIKEQMFALEVDMTGVKVEIPAGYWEMFSEIEIK